MKKFAGFTKERVAAELKWVARHSTGYRFVGSWEEVEKHCALNEDDDYDYIKDVDILCEAGQTPDMAKFVAAWEETNRAHGFTTLHELFEKYGEEE